MRNKTRFWLLATSLAAIATSAQAQSTPPAASATPAADAGTGVADIVVTATRREEKLQRVPIAITAFDSKALDQAGITDISRLEGVTPGFTGGSTGSDSRLAMRGINTDNSRQASADASVAFFVDGVYQSANQQALTGFVDLARVEIQRGPQGTLYGRNSFGGNISLVTNQPTDKFEGSISGEYGSFHHYRLEGVLNAPLANNLSIRLVGLRDYSDGYVQNLDPSGSRAGDVDDYYFRGALKWEPDSQTKVTLRGTAWIGNGHGSGAYEYKVGGILSSPDVSSATAATVVLPINPRARPSDSPSVTTAVTLTGDNGATFTGIPVPSDPWTIDQNTPSIRRIRSYNGTLDITHDFDFATFKLIGAYTNFAAYRFSDGDFTQYNLRSNVQDSLNKTGTVEAQLASRPGTQLQWVAGLYYLTTSASEYFNQYLFYSNPPGYNANNIGYFGTQSYAAYAQATYKLTPELGITGGIRYTNDRKTTSGLDFTGAPATPYAATNFHKFTWRGGIDYQVDPGKLLYATVSSGFRSGGFNTGVTIASLETFQPETVTAYEVGAKTRWLDNVLQLNISAFINKYKSLQVLGFDPVSLASYTENAGQETAKGIELETVLKPTKAVDLGLTASYLDAYFTSGQAIDPISYASNVDLTGHRAGQSPKWRLGAYASVTFDIPGAGSLTPRVQTSYASSYYLLNYNTIIEYQGSHTKTDVRLTFETLDKKYSIEAFGTNLENNAVATGGEFGGRGAFFIGYAPPREWGVRVGARF